jgi:hypothetical protein
MTLHRWILAPLLALTIEARAQSLVSPESGQFEIAVAAPPVPALKYQFFYNGAIDPIPGNAAILYLDSVLLMGSDSVDKAEKALEAYQRQDFAQFNTLAQAMNYTGLYQEVDLAGRRQECEWQTPMRDMGGGTLLPHLRPLRDLERILEVRALQQIDGDRIDDAIASLRSGYVLSRNVGKERVLISLLISEVGSAAMNDATGHLMSSPDSPNLYWAIVNIPTSKSLLEDSMGGETQWLASTGLMVQRLHDGDLTAEEWKSVLQYASQLLGGDAHDALSADSIVQMTSPQLQARARQEYAASHHLTPDQASRVDPLVAICAFYYQQYRIALDEMFKLRTLPYPVLLAKSREYDDYKKKLIDEQPLNFFLQALGSIHKPIWRAAEVDRQAAALATVEAIRSYAAANNRQFPAHLDDIKDTPAPENPATGLPFNYTVDNDSVTISDSQSEEPMRYTVKLRH